MHHLHKKEYFKVKGTTWIQQERGAVFSLAPDSLGGIESYYNCIPQEHVKSAKKWMGDGLFLRNQMPPFAENPTLTGYCPQDRSKPYFYCIPSDVLPFRGWDYIQVKKFKFKDSLVTMYGAYIENLLKMVMRKLCNKQVYFQILLCDCMGIERYIDKKTKYDRILTSNLMDYIILPDLLKVCSEKLNHGNTYATIVTETQNWSRDICPDVELDDFSNALALFSGPGETALKDTKNRQLVKDGGVGFVEYIDNSTDFIDLLRALFYAYTSRKEFRGRHNSSDLESQKVPTLKVLGNGFKLQLRDCFRNENRIAHFKIAVNRRRVTMITGYERILEWIPLQSE